jgi:acetyl-CoA acetyltransferase
MNDLPDVVVLSATRTAIGRYGGGLAGVPPCDLAATVVREAVSRAGVEPADVGHAVFGNVIHTETRDMYLGRVAAVNGGLPVTTPAFTVNRLCGSGLQAIISAAQAIKLGDADAAVAPWPSSASSTCRRSGPTRTAAASRSVTRWPPPAPSWSSRHCMSCGGPAAGTRSSPCASAAARASPRSSNEREPSAHGERTVQPRTSLRRS